MKQSFTRYLALTRCDDYKIQRQFSVLRELHIKKKNIYNRIMFKVGRNPWRPSSPMPPLRAASTTADCSELRPVRF